MTKPQIKKLEKAVREFHARSGSFTLAADVLGLEIKDVIYLMKSTDADKAEHFKNKTFSNFNFNV